MSDSNNNSKSIGFFTLLGLLFIGLKLSNVISWSWWLVLLPLYGWFIVAIILMIPVIILSIFK